MTIVRSVLSVLVGFIAFMVSVSISDMLASSTAVAMTGVPAPASLEEYQANYDKYPAVFFLLMLAGWTGSAFIGSSFACIIASRAKWIHGTVIGVLAMLGTIANLAMLPHPVWLNACVVTIPLAVLVANYLFGKNRTATPSVVDVPSSAG